MDSDDHQNRLDDSSQDDQKGSNLLKKSSKKIEEMNSSPADDKPKGDDQEETSKKPTSKIHRCEYCGKTFPNGKSLGGHKRSHTEALRKKGLRAHNKVNCNSIQSSNQKYNCHVCNKDFLSSKALYGHMRSHPERLWRGIHPPDNLDSIEKNEDNDDQNFSAVESPTLDASKSFLPRWYKTDQRGRQCICSHDVFNAAQILMCMSHDKWSCSMDRELPQHVNLNEDVDCDRLDGGKALSTKFGDKTVLVNLDDEEGEKEYENVDCTKVECYVKNIKEVSSGKKGEVISSTNGQEDHVSDVDETVEMMMKKKKKLKLIMKYKNLYSESKNEIFQTQDENQCGFQDKHVSAIQVEGGHKSSHNEEKNNKPSDDTGEANPRIHDLNLNELPNVMKDKTN